MIFNIIVLYILIWKYAVNASSQWKLIWNDEFNTNRIDLSKWNIESDNNFCTGNHNKQLQCYTNNENNIKQTDNVLAITARKEINGKYTSAMVYTKFSFTYGRVEIRAALSTGKLLRPSIWMVNEDGAPDWPKSGQIDVMSNIQTTNIYSGVHYYNNEKKPNYLGVNFNDRKVLSKISFSDYHVYTIEWSNEWIQWFFDGYQYYNVSTSRKLSNFYDRNGQPFDHNFKLYLHLGIGGELFFPNQVLTDNDANNWGCSALIIDYIRIFQLNHTSLNNNMTQPFDDTISSANSICANLMEKSSVTGNTVYVWIIIPIIIVILLMSLLICLYLKRKRSETDLKPNLKPNNNLNTNNYSDFKYDDTYCGNEDYAEINGAEANQNYEQMRSGLNYDFKADL